MARNGLSLPAAFIYFGGVRPCHHVWRFYRDASHQYSGELRYHFSYDRLFNK